MVTPTSDIIVGDRYITIVSDFSCLVSVISRDLFDELGVNKRIQKAGNAIGMMRKCLFSSPVVKTKPNVYGSFILYGVECGSLNENLLNRLRRFHRRCVRSICHVTLTTRLRTVDLLERMLLESNDTYVYRQQLRWVGHVIRMQWS